MSPTYCPSWSPCKPLLISSTTILCWTPILDPTEGGCDVISDLNQARTTSDLDGPAGRPSSTTGIRMLLPPPAPSPPPPETAASLADNEKQLMTLMNTVEMSRSRATMHTKTELDTMMTLAADRLPEEDRWLKHTQVTALYIGKSYKSRGWSRDSCLL